MLPPYITPTRADFLLQLDYFRIATRFFIPAKFHPQTNDYIARNLKEISRKEMGLTTYGKSGSYYRHQREILSGLGFTGFARRHRSQVRDEARRLTHLQVKPAAILETCVS